MKKFISALLAVVLLLMSMPVLGLAVSNKTVESIEIHSLPHKTILIWGVDSYTNIYEDYVFDIDGNYVCDEFGNPIVNGYEYEEFEISTDGLKIKVNFSDGTYEITDELWDYMDSYFNVIGQSYGEEWGIGVHEVTVSLYNCQTTFDVEVIENPVESIEIAKMPDNTTLVMGKDSYTDTYYEYSYDEYGNEIMTEYEYERFYIDESGLKMKVNFTDGTSEIVDNLWDYMNSFFNVTGQEYGELWDIGTHTAKVSFYGCETTFEVEIVENPVDSIEVYSLPNKTTFVCGIDSTTNIYYDYSYDEFGNEYISEYEYEDFYISTEGLKMKVNFIDGTYEITDNIWDYMDSYFSVTGQEYGEVWGVGTHEVTVSFYNRETSFEVEVIENPVNSIELVSLPLKEEYLDCEWVNLIGAEIKVNFKDGTNKTVTIDENDCYDEYSNWMFDCGKTDGAGWSISLGNREGNIKRCAFNYLGHSAKFDINVIDKTIEKVEILTKPEMANGVGAEIKITYSDETSVKTKILEFDSRLGDNVNGLFTSGGCAKTGVGIYKGFYAFENLFDVQKTTFRFGLGNDNFDENSVPYTDFDKIFAMQKTDKLEWTLGGGYNWEFSLDGQWFEGELTEENIDAMMYTARYLVGYLFDIDYQTKEISGDVAKEMLTQIFDIKTVDLTLSQFYNSDEDIYEFAVADGGWGEGPVEETYYVEEYNDCLYVKKTVDVFDDTSKITKTYYAFFEEDGRCSYFNSTPKVFSSLELDTLPTKTEYFVGDEVDLNGLKLKYTNEENKESIIESGIEANITVINSTEIACITVSYNELTVEIPIVVKPLELTKISIDALPNKLYYNCGETFDSTGLKLLLTYNSGKTEIIDSGFECAPELLSVAGNQVISVTYNDFITTFTVNVTLDEPVTNGKVNSVLIDNIEMNYKDSTTITPTIDIDDGVAYTVSYSSSDNSVAQVDENGNVYASSKGEATITCTITDEYGNTVTDTCNVEVKYTFWQWLIVIVLFGWIWY